MTAEPSYLPLLQHIADRETSGAVLFSVWAAHTAEPLVAAMLRTVALREEEHALAFRKRVDELGFIAVPRVDADLGGRVAIAVSSEMGTKQKFEMLGFGAPRPDPFARMFDDTSIDINTGALLGRYIAEERDSARMIDACYEGLGLAAD